VIRSFKDKETEGLFNRLPSKKLPQSIQQAAYRKLRYLNRAVNLNDLRSPPGNHLEKLKGGRDEQYSIRINDQVRICFIWDGEDAAQVEITGYHRKG
jgi:proteic killer suppression protein